MYNNDNTWEITIPSCIGSEPYVIRHETMAVKDADELEEAQFYPQCSQVRISGVTGTSEPDLVPSPEDM